MDTLSTIKRGFTDPVSHSQLTFRKVLAAMSTPGLVMDLGFKAPQVEPVGQAITAISLSLFDFEASVWIEEPYQSLLKRYLHFHSGCQVTEQAELADFALLSGNSGQLDLFSFKQGSEESPELSTTLLIHVDDLNSGSEVLVSGPGNLRPRSLKVTGLVASFWSQWKEQHEMFPLGVDVILASGSQLVALPRTALVEFA